MNYDPGTHGFDTSVWKAIGSDPTIFTGAFLSSLLFNDTSAVSKVAFGRGVFYFEMKIPTAPTAGDYRAWGLRNFGTGASAQFIIDGEDFMAYVSDGNGNTDSDEITWNDAWTNTDTVFRINFTPAGVKFHVGETPVSILNSSGSPKSALHFFVRNDNADDLSLNGLTGRAVDIYATSFGVSGATDISSSPVTSTTSAEPYAHYQNNSFQSAVVKASEGHVYSLMVTNTTAGDLYLQLHNATATLSGGETAFVKTLVPGLSAVVLGTDFFGEAGAELDTGIVVAASSTAATFTATTAGSLLVDIFYDGTSGSPGYLLNEDGGSLMFEDGRKILLED